MYNKLFACFFVLLSFAAQSQIRFEKGYYIDNNDNKINCLIRNMDWRSNPSEIQYKLDEKDQPITVSMQQLKMFEIENESKYEKFTIDVDQSTDNINDLGYDRNPQFKKQTILLRILLEGKATLFQYTDGNTNRFFFKTDTTAVNQLVFKTYKIEENQLGENNYYKQQLATTLKSDNISTDDFKRLSYKKNDLVKIFTKYNSFYNSEIKSFKNQEKRDVFNLTVRPGITSTKLNVTNNVANIYDAEFSNEIGFRLGLEAEFVLPFNKNKWAIIIEPTYQNYSSEIKNARGYTAKIDYNTIEFPIGVRYNMFLNNDSKIFTNAQYVMEKALNAKGVFGTNEIEIEPKASFVVGLGYNYKKKYSAEVRANFGKELFGSYVYWISDYKAFSFVLGYTIF